MNSFIKKYYAKSQEIKKLIVFPLSPTSGEKKKSYSVSLTHISFFDTNTLPLNLVCLLVNVQEH